jgi:hypothetical protein
VAGLRIQVHGLKEFRRGLRQMDRNLPKGLRHAGNKAADIIVGEAKPKVPLGPGRGGHARTSVRAQSTATAARVAGGSKKFPYYGWLDFGSKKKYHLPERRYLQEGRYIWRAFADRRADVESELRDALVEVAENAGVNVR